MNKNVKTGVIVKFNGDVNYYAANNEAALRKLPKIENANRKTFKQFGKSVTIKNRLFQVEMFDDGELKITPHSQLVERVSDILNE